MNNLNELLKEICSTISIRYINASGASLPVKYGKLDDLLPLHSNAETRLYLEMISEGGVPSYKILGVITSRLQMDQVTGMHLKAEYTDKEGKLRQIWINNQDYNNVRVIIPTPIE